MRVMIWLFVAALTVACGDDGNGKGTSATNSKGKTDGTNGGACPTAFSSNGCPDGCNPCSRLSDDQVAAVTGMAGVKGQWDSDACLWDYSDSNGDPSFEIGFHINTDYATFEDECDPGGAPVQGIMVTPVSGVGDEACYVTTPVGSLGSFELNFLKGCYGYAISVSGPAGKPPPFPDATAKDYEKKLALDAVPNL